MPNEQLEWPKISQKWPLFYERGHQAKIGQKLLDKTNGKMTPKLKLRVFKKDQTFLSSISGQKNIDCYFWRMNIWDDSPGKDFRVLLQRWIDLKII